MAFQSQDGKSFTNRPPMMQHNKSLKAKMGMADPLKQPGGAEDEMGGDGSQVAQEHGPAVEVNVMHNHEAGEHHVSSKHPDGHQHESMHGSVDEAHEHAKKLAGSGMQENEQQGEEPEYE